MGPPHSSMAASMLFLSRRSSLIALAPGSVTSAKSMTTTSAPRSWTSAAVAAPIPVAPPTTRARFPSKRNDSLPTLNRLPPSIPGRAERFFVPTVSVIELDPHEAEAVADVTNSVLGALGCRFLLTQKAADHEHARHLVTNAAHHAGIVRCRLGAVFTANRAEDRADSCLLDVDCSGYKFEKVARYESGHGA